jgi:hypothetical protein
MNTAIMYSSVSNWFSYAFSVIPTLYNLPSITTVAAASCASDIFDEPVVCLQLILEANWVVSAWMLQKEDPFNLMVPNPRIKMTVVPIQDR